MTPEHELLERLLGLVVEGSRIDWDAYARQAISEEERWTIQNLHVVAQVREISMTSTSATPTVAPRLEKWRHLQIVELLGSGAFGDVYRAWDPQLHREVALKLLRGDTSDAEWESNVVSEGRLFAQVSSENVARVYGVESSDGRVGLWMEYIDGPTLQQLIAEQKRFSARETARIGIDLCTALSAIHAAQVLHGDLKPQNVIRTQHGRIVLTDFGAGINPSLVVGSTTKATAPYTAPELFEAQKASPAADVYSLGVVLHELVSGEQPVSARTFNEIAQLHRAGQRRHLRDVRPDLPVEFTQVVEKASAANVDDRYRTAGEMKAALLAFVSAEDSEASAPSKLRTSPAVVNREELSELPRTELREVRWPANRSATRSSRPSWWIMPSIAVAITVFGVVIWRGMESRAALVQAAATFRAQRGGTARILHSGDEISAQDQLTVTFELARTAYLYLLKIDSSGTAAVLFPTRDGELKNPLKPRVPQQLAAGFGGQGRAENQPAVGGIERFLLVASVEVLAEFEQQSKALPLSSWDEELSALNTDHADRLWVQEIRLLYTGEG